MSFHQPSNESLQSIFELLALSGVALNADDIKVQYQNKNGYVSIAIPRIRFGLAFQGDDAAGLVKEGWEIQNISNIDVEPFARVFYAVKKGIIAQRKAKMDPNIKQTSKPEEVLLDAILWNNLPEPDRNKKFFREDGTELTTPDFTWEEYRLAFFMDGAYWHSIKDDNDAIRELKTNKKTRNQIIAQRSDKVRKDGDIRSELGSLGYIVLSCTDADLETEDGVQRQVERIAKVIKQTQSSQRINTDGLVDDLDDLDDLFTSTGSGLGDSDLDGSGHRVEEKQEDDTPPVVDKHDDAPSSDSEPDDIDDDFDDDDLDSITELLENNSKKISQRYFSSGKEHSN